jgi:hypothetical protein
VGKGFVKNTTVFILMIEISQGVDVDALAQDGKRDIPGSCGSLIVSPYAFGVS